MHEIVCTAFGAVDRSVYRRWPLLRLWLRGDRRTKFIFWRVDNWNEHVHGCRSLYSAGAPEAINRWSRERTGANLFGRAGASQYLVYMVQLGAGPRCRVVGARQL